jgi:hypothetical protein
MAKTQLTLWTEKGLPMQLASEMLRLYKENRGKTQIEIDEENGQINMTNKSYETFLLKR